LMSIIVALFMGLTVSAEEIIRDRKILKRESFLNLSWNSYLISKISILFLLSAVQTLTFVLVSNLILEIHGMTLSYWFILFSASCFANVLGLNISSAFNSAVTVYILIPILLIPQMILSGVLFSFDKLHHVISNKEKVPIIADLMVSRWAYEAMAVHQFVNNEYEKPFFQYEKAASVADYKSAFLADELLQRQAYLSSSFQNQEDSVQRKVDQELAIIKSALMNETFKGNLAADDLKAGLTRTGYTGEFDKALAQYLKDYRQHYQKIYNEQVLISDKKKVFFQKSGFDLNEEKNRYYNESLADLVKNVNTKERITLYNGRLVQLNDPVYQDPAPLNALDYRTGFFVARKQFFGLTFSTFLFNSIAIWGMTILLYILLYFEALRKLLKLSFSLPIVYRK